MFRKFVLPMMVGLGISFTGCGETSAVPTAEVSSPLTIDAWKAMNPKVKFHPATLDSLKEHNPELQSSKGWKKFQKEILIPERQLAGSK